MALDFRETAQLMAVLQMEDHSFQAVLEALRSLTKAEGAGGSRVCVSLLLMLQDGYFQSHDNTCASELLITAFILHSVSSLSQSSKPPQPSPARAALFFVLQHIQTELQQCKDQHDEEGFREALCLKVFLLQCLADGQHVLQRTPRQVLRDDLQTLLAAQQQLSSNEALTDALVDAEQAYHETWSHAASPEQRGVTPLVISPAYPGIDSGPLRDYSSQMKQHSLDLRFEPVCARPSPPPLGVCEPELSWLYTEGYTTDLIWDATMSAPHSDDSLELRDTVQKALRQTLANDEQQSLKQKLMQNHDALLRVGLCPLRLPALVERNWPVAQHFLITLLQRHPQAAEEFLVALAHMNPCLAVCNVMGELVKQKQMPVQHVHTFIEHALSASTKQKISLISHFCTLLARETDPTSNKARVLQSKPLLAKITQFAVDNASVPEASALFKALKEREEREKA